jgi:hypothetical protein
VASELIISTPGPAVSLDVVKGFELRNSISLPNEYRQFLLKTNGGWPSHIRFEVPGWPGKWAPLQYFFHLEDEKYSLEYWFEFLKDDLPEGMIAIAVDLGGNFICLDTVAPYEGEVYYWDSSQDYGLTDEDDTMFLVGETFDDFLDNLQPDEQPSSEGGAPAA